MMCNIHRSLGAFCLSALTGLALMGLPGCGGGGEVEENNDTSMSSDAAQRPNSSSAPSSAPSSALSSAQGESLPEHNPEARFEGKTALEYAAELSDLSTDIRGRALVMINQFGVDGLPAREKVRELVESTRAEPEIRLLALGTLLNMQAPGAVDLAREKLANPQFVEGDAMWRNFILGLRDDNVIDDQALRADVLQIARDDPQHAARLMMLRALPEDAQQALTKAIFESDHSPAVRDYFLANFNAMAYLGDEPRQAFLTQLVEQDIEAAAQLMARRALPEPFQQHLTLAVFNADQKPDTALAYFFQILPGATFIEDDAKVAFIGDNAPFASRPQYLDRTHQILLSVGTEAAMDQALRYGAMMPDRRYPLMIEFAQAKTDPNIVFDRMMHDLTESNDQNMISQIGVYIESLVLNTAGRGDAGASVSERFVSVFGTMINDGQSDNHRAVAALYLVSYVRQTKDLPALPALEPVFAVMNNADAPDLVRGTAGTQLTEAANDLADREGFIERTVQALWEGEDVNATHFPEQILLAIGRYQPGVRSHPDLAGRATRVLEALLASDIDAHLNDWSITPATALMLTLAGDINTMPEGIYGTPIMEQTSAALGKILTKGNINTGYKTEELKWGLHGMVRVRTNSLDGIIAICEPIFLAPQPTVAQQILQDKFGHWGYEAVFSSVLAATQAEPAVQERWRVFLQKVIDAQVPEVSGYAQSGLARFEQRR